MLAWSWQICKHILPDIYKASCPRESDSVCGVLCQAVGTVNRRNRVKIKPQQCAL